MELVAGQPDCRMGLEHTARMDSNLALGMNDQDDQASTRQHLWRSAKSKPAAPHLANSTCRTSALSSHRCRGKKHKLTKLSRVTVLYRRPDPRISLWKMRSLCPCSFVPAACSAVGPVFSWVRNLDTPSLSPSTLSFSYDPLLPPCPYLLLTYSL